MTWIAPITVKIGIEINIVIIKIICNLLPQVSFIVLDLSVLFWGICLNLGIEFVSFRLLFSRFSNLLNTIEVKKSLLPLNHISFFPLKPAVE